MCGVDGETYGNPCMLDVADVKLDYSGECVIEEPTPESESLPMTAIVSLPPGSAVPGCEDTNECYLPYEINVAIGATVSWSNDDSAAHTVTSGSVTAGPTGVFDSSLFMAGDVYEFTFEEAGTYDYFCMVHPWMTGIVNVN
jgi:plastocyanin